MLITALLNSGKNVWSEEIYCRLKIMGGNVHFYARYKCQQRMKICRLCILPWYHRLRRRSRFVSKCKTLGSPQTTKEGCIHLLLPRPPAPVAAKPHPANRCLSTSPARLPRKKEVAFSPALIFGALRHRQHKQVTRHVGRPGQVAE